MNEKYESGLQGEREAQVYLEKKGYILKDTRLRRPGGEIDIVMEQGAFIVFVEVKYRPMGRRGDGLMAITEKKKRRIRAAANKYLIEKKWLDRCARFDVIEITGDGILHIENAF